MPAFVGDHSFYIIGALIIISSIGWLRRPLWRWTKSGLRSIFSSDDKTKDQPASPPSARTP